MSESRSRVAGSARKGDVRLAGLPACAGTDLLVEASRPEVIARAPVWKNDLGAGFYPFYVRLFADSEGVRIVWAPEGRPGATDMEGRPVLTRRWANGQWDEESIVAGGGKEFRFAPDAVWLGGDAWMASWYEIGGPGKPELFSRLVGCVCEKSTCEAPRRLTDNEYDIWGAYHPLLAGDAEGRGHVFWAAEGQGGGVPYFFEGSSGISSLRTKPYGAPFEAPSERVSPPGRYFIRPVMSVVHRLEPGKLELVYFKDSERREYNVAEPGVSADLFLTSREQNGWSRPKALFTTASGFAPGSIEEAAAFRSPTGDLLVVYGDGLSRVGVLQRKDGRGGHVKIIASGLSTEFAENSPTLRAAMGRDGSLSIVYRALMERRGQYLWLSEAGSERPYYLLLSSADQCLASEEVAKNGPGTSLFDVAVDVNGLTHVVWAQSDGTTAELAHRWYKFRDPGNEVQHRENN